MRKELFPGESRANCRNSPYDFSDHTQTNQVHLKRICDSCPVRAECLDYALHHEKFNWWAISQRARTKMRKELGIPEPPAALLPETRIEIDDNYHARRRAAVRKFRAKQKAEAMA